MEPDKFEKHIQDTLKNREIVPSERAWERILDGLDAQPVKKTKQRRGLWYGMAASILVLIGISFLYFGNGEIDSPNPIQVVVTDADENGIDKGPDRDNEDKKETTVQEGNTETQMVPKNQLEELKMPTESVLAQADPSEPVDKALKQETRQILESHKEVPMALVNNKVIKDKIAEVVAQVELLERTTTVTDAEVDSLLKQAQQDILRDRIFKDDASVDAVALLSEVEEELDRSFRDQIFESLKSGFLKVRTAVAERNN